MKLSIVCSAINALLYGCPYLHRKHWFAHNHIRSWQNVAINVLQFVYLYIISCCSTVTWQGAKMVCVWIV